MKVPKVFISGKNLDKKIEELLTKKILTYKLKHDKLTFEVSVIKYGEEFIIEYPVDSSKSVIGKKIRMIQPRIGKNGLNDLIALAESISSYHNKNTSLSAMIKEKDGQKKGVCTISLDHPLSVDDFSKALTTFYPDNVDTIKSVEAKYYVRQ